VAIAASTSAVEKLWRARVDPTTTFWNRKANHWRQVMNVTNVENVVR
jgi:hypothetical protein